MAYYNKETKELFQEFETDINGLSKIEAEKRLLANGRNEIKKKAKISALKILFSQFSNILIILLIIAAMISLLLGQRNDAIVLLCIIFLNSGIGFFQEYKASKAIEALKKMISETATVIRNGEKIQIPTTEIVIGDIIILSEGDKVPADARIIEESALKIDESVLTGESVPESKITKSISKLDLLPQDQKNMVFTGTSVTHGTAKAIVIATGEKTEFGKIANMTQTIEEELSPLQKEISLVGKVAARVAITISIIVLLLGILRGNDILEMFLFAISISVAAVPEGLPTTLVISLSIALQKMAKKNAIVRRLSSVETLGATTVICSDKTGTITKNQMTVKKIWTNEKIIEITGLGYEPIGEFSEKGKKINPTKIKELNFLLHLSLLCNNSKLSQNEKNEYSIIGDPTEGALVVMCEKIGLKSEQLNKKYQRILEIPFDSETKRMITINNYENEKYAFSKGALHEILKICDKLLINGKEISLTKNLLNKILEQEKIMGEDALRVLGFAYKKIGKNDLSKLNEKQFVFLGLAGMNDPPRPEIKEAVRVCKEAGIRINIITGDFGITAKAIAKEVGIAKDSTPIITGDELEKMADTQLMLILKKEAIFARVSPLQKLRIVSLLQDMGEIVAVTGDGVNDAPALKKASIGIAMGIAGTDVAKESCDMVLADDSFATIISAIREGRIIYDNLKKLVYYNLAGITGEIFVVFISILLGLIFHTTLLPLLAIQILLIDLGVEVLPSLAFAFEPEEKGLMQRNPRNPKERILNKSILLRLFMVGTLISIGALFLFYRELTMSGWVYGASIDLHKIAYIKATTMVFFTIIMFQMFNAFNSKTQEQSLFKTNILNNKWLILAVTSSILMMVAFSYIPFFNMILHTSPLSLFDWVLIVGISSTIILFEEIRKFILRRSQTKILG